MWFRIDNNVTNLFCAGHAFLPDGRLLVLGGHEGINYFGSVDTTTFEYQNGYRWVRQNAPMNAGRWYASAVTLANGEVLVLSGAVDGSNRQNTLPQVWRTNEGGGWRNLTSAALKLPNYPKIYVAPDGRVISIGPERLTRFLNTSDAGAWTPGPATRHPLKRVYGTSVMYGDGKFLVVGGSDKVGTPPTNTCETLDLNTPAPAWQWTNSLSFARKHCNATLLPDGKVLVTGGSNSVAFNDAAGAIFAAELWDPATGQWTRMSSARVPRIYHSSAVLLPDARVLVAGGGRPKAKNGGLNNTNCELFWPPYFGRGPRPVIWSAPPVVNYGQQFNIHTPDVANVAHVRLLSYGTTTHTFNMSQRLKSLAFSRPTGTRLQVLMETDPKLLPPGYYMLFLLNQLEVPSFAWSIRVT